MGQISITPAIVVLLAGLVAALTDIWRFKVYNVLTFPLVLSGLAFHGITGGRRDWARAWAVSCSGSSFCWSPT